MNFVDLINEANNVAKVEKEQELTDEATRKKEIVEIRNRIVAEQIGEFANRHNMEYLRLESIKHSCYFIVGGLVFNIRVHGIVDKAKRDEIEKRQVLWQHQISLVGFDITEQIREVKIGTLALLSAEGVLKAFNRGDQFEFAANEVVGILAPRET